MKTFPLLLCLGLLSIAADAREVAVSIRYLAPKGVSHATIFLFDGEGKLVRQLSHPRAEQDREPVFSPDGKEIVFHREHGDEDAAKRFFLVDREGKHTRAIEGEMPAWFAQRTIAKAFEDGEGFLDELTAKNPERTLRSPDGKLALVLKLNPADDEHPLAFLREKNGPLQPLAKMPGFSIFWYPMLHHGSPFFSTTKLRLAFYCGEHDSTNGTATYALDTLRKRVVTLSANGAAVYPWPGHAGFFVGASLRYEPLGDGRTVNCGYLDYYDGALKRVRFGHALGIYGGASIFSAGDPPICVP